MFPQDINSAIRKTGSNFLGRLNLLKSNQEIQSRIYYLEKTATRDKRLIVKAAGAGRAAARSCTLRFSVVVCMESGTLEDNSGTCSDHSFCRTPAFGAFSISGIIHLMKFIKLMTAIAASVFVSWHCIPFQSVLVMVIAWEEQAFMQAAHPAQPRFTYAFPLALILILL